jgi:hypothetical protein
MDFELICDRGEVLVFMDALGVERLPGLDMPKFQPQSQEEHRALLQAGLAELKRRQLVFQENGKVELPRQIVEAFAVLARPGLLAVIHRTTPGLGQQNFYHAIAAGRGVEWTFPTAETYRLATLSSAEGLLKRLYEILPLQGALTGLGTLSMPHAAVLQVDQLLVDGSRNAARDLYYQQARGAEAWRKALWHAINRHTFIATLTLLKIAGDEAVDAQDYLVIQGQESAWLFRQDAQELETILILPMTGELFTKEVAGAFSRLLR